MTDGGQPTRARSNALVTSTTSSRDRRVRHDVYVRVRNQASMTAVHVHARPMPATQAWPAEAIDK